MEIVRTRVLTVLLTGMLWLSVSSCAKGNPPELPTAGADPAESGTATDEPFDKSQAVALTENGASAYLIVRSAGSGSREKALAESVRAAILERSGVRLPSVTDDSTAAEKSRGFEILIGKTNRPESLTEAKRLRYRDYSVTVSGNRILLSGESDYMLQSAVDAFLGGLTVQDGILYSTCRVTVCGSYPVSDMTANGVPIGEYRIVYAAGNALASDLAEQIAGLLRDETGWMLECVPDREVETAYEMLVGATDRAESGEVAAFLRSGEIAMQNRNGKVVFAWSDPYAADLLTVRLSNALLADRKEATHELTALAFRSDAGQALLANATGLTVMSFNILGVGSTRTSCYNRDDLTASVIRAYLPDIIGFQEFDAPFRLETESLFDLLGDTYSEAVCPEAAPDRNWNPILYRTDRLELLACGNQAFTQGTEWPLAQTYPSDSKVTHHRTVTHAVFRIRESGQKVIVLNAHFHVDDRMSAGESDAILASEAQEVLELAAQLRRDEPDAVLFVIGDFNSTVSGRVMQTLSAGGFSDTYPLAERKTDVCGFHAKPTFNSAKELYDECDGSFPADGYRYAIDHCMVLGENVAVGDYRTVTLRDALLVSDHCPLLCRVFLGGE